MNHQFYFSVVIPSLNEEKYLPLLLADLTKQTFFRDKFEVIVIDGQSEDQTVKAANKFANQLNLQVCQVKKRNVSYQRNYGAKHAHGDWILFMDADNRLPKNFLDGVKYQLVKKADIDVFTTWTATQDSSTLNKAIVNIINLGTEAYQLIEKPSAIGAMIGCRRTVMNQIKFDEKQKFLEDGYFIQAVHKAGFRFEVFREPKYIYSMRRLKKEGTLKLAGSMALLQLQYLQGKDFHHISKLYPMEGGKYYEGKAVPFLKQMRHFLENASKKQLQQAKKILSALSEI